MEIAAIMLICFGGAFTFAGILGLQNIDEAKDRSVAGGFIDALFGAPVAFFRGLSAGLRSKGSPLRPMSIVFLVGATLFTVGLMIWKISPDKPKNTESGGEANRIHGEAMPATAAGG